VRERRGVLALSEHVRLDSAHCRTLLELLHARLRVAGVRVDEKEAGQSVG
jgi:hypothetical protein